ncbi:MAG: tetratricopeptide repeat protein [Gemmatimonadota bacterium]|nr:tetratricopeptide repeat protein [Gemmatimonadota bacterium]
MTHLFNTPEVTTVKAFRRQASITGQVVLLAGLAGSVPGSIAAQRSRVQAPPEGTSRFVVPTLRSKEKGLGVQAADAIRSRLAQDFPLKDLYVIDKNNISGILEASGFQPNEPPDRVTARLLAQQLRADQYLEGVVSKEGSNFRIESAMVLARDNAWVQPLPVAEGGRLLDAATKVSRSLQDARKQLPHTEKCVSAIRDGKNDEAITTARAAIAAYPLSTYGRICLAQAMVNTKAPIDSVISVTTKTLEIDPRNKLALQIAAQAYTDAKNEEKAVEAWTQLVAYYPTDVKSVENAVREIAASGNPRQAAPIIRKAVEENPGDPSLVRLNFLILLAAREWKSAIGAGEEMARLDTAAVDTIFFNRLATAYASDSQPQKAAETTARGVAKFPNNAALLTLHARVLKQAGQTQQSVEAARRALALEPKNVGGWLSLADAQVELNMADSAVAALRMAIPNATDPEKQAIAQRLLIIGNNAYKAGNASKNRADFTRAVGILALSDSISASPQAKFLRGVSAFQIAASIAQDNQKMKDCALARTAQDMMVIAQINVPAGGSFAPEPAKQLLGQIAQFAPAIEGQFKKFCK